MLEEGSRRYFLLRALLVLDSVNARGKLKTNIIIRFPERNGKQWQTGRETCHTRYRPEDRFLRMAVVGFGSVRNGIFSLRPFPAYGSCWV